MNLEFKLKKVLYLYGLLLFFILLRVWFLSVLNYEKMQKLSILPRRKSVSIAASRGLVKDQNQQILACNQKRFDIAILYKDIRSIPSYEYVFENGKKSKFFKRKAYIEDLSLFLSDYTNLTKDEIEDFIYGRAALFQDTLLTLKEGVGENIYHRLKILEKDWPGLRMIISQTRHYPKEKVGCHVIGYLGAIDQKTYLASLSEKRILKNYIEDREKGLTPSLPKGYQSPFEVREKYNQLCQKSYNLVDLVGIDGIEKSFDVHLRGGAGRRYFETTRLGRVIQELPGSLEKQKPSQIELAIDIDLQEKAEMLLAERESTDELFAKGGACVVIDVKTSKVLALASYPRFNPQDFASKNQKNIHKWTESDVYIRRLYEGLEDVEKEKFSSKKGFFVSQHRLTYKDFLTRILSEKSDVLDKILKVSSVRDAYHLIDSFEKLHEKFGFIDPLDLIKELTSSSVKDEETLSLLEGISKHLKSSKDPLLFLDIIRLQVDPKKISPDALDILAKLNLSEFFHLSQELAKIYESIELHLKKPFETCVFLPWRKEHFKEFLKTKRQEELELKTYARPFTEYLEKEKNRQFREFTRRYRSYFAAYLFGKIKTLKPQLSDFSTILSQLQTLDSVKQFKNLLLESDLEKTAAFLRSFRSFQELKRPLYGSYTRLLDKKKHSEKDLALAFYPRYKLGYLKSNAYRFTAPQGSVFKIAVAYEAIKERLEGKIKKLPVIIDSLSHEAKNKKDQILGFDENKQPIRRWHKGGLLPRSSHSGIGTVDVISALEQSSNIYFSLLASEYIKDPSCLIDTAKKMGLGQKTGIELPFEMKGKLPEDLHANKTGLYAFAIGQHELLVTPLQTAEMMASLFQDGTVRKPQIISKIHETKKLLDDVLDSNHDSAISQSLSHLGCFFPLFSESLHKASGPVQKFSLPVVKNNYLVNPEIVKPIKKGLDKVVWGEKGTARPQAIASMLNSNQMHDYMKLKHLMVGKTGTAEQRVIETLDSEAESRMLNHIWFAAVSFEDTSQEEPELAICVYLKDGKLGGKEAAPIAAKLIEFYKSKKLKP